VQSVAWQKVNKAHTEKCGEKVNEVFFYRLIVNCDDFGRLDARKPIIKSKLYPLKSITDEQIDKALNKLSSVGMILLYEYEQKPYLQIVAWRSHQTIRNTKSKYPPPDKDEKLQAIEINCNQLHADEFNCARYPIQSNPCVKESNNTPFIPP